QLALQRAEIVAVCVPAADCQRHAAHAGLDQPAGREELLNAPVAIARTRLFPGQVECLANGPRGDHVKSARREDVEALHGAAGVDLAANAVKARQQGPAILDTCLVDARGKLQILQTLAGRGEGAMSNAEKAGFLSKSLPAQTHERRHALAISAAQLGDNGSE